MANSEIGAAYLSVIAKMDGGFAKQAEASAAALGSKMGSLITKAIAAAGIGAALKQAFDGYAQYEQLVGGVDKLYGEASGKLQQYAADAYKTSGMSANAYMETATSFSAALVSSLGDVNLAADQTDVAMRAISDNVNVFGSNAEDVQNAFKGFAKQNYTMLDNLKLGYGGTKTEMERLISDANAWAKENGKAADLTIDSFSDVVTAIDYIQQKQGIAGTTAKEAATTIEGSLTMVRASWENLVSRIGDPSADVGLLVSQMFESLGTAASNVLPLVENIAGGVAEAMPAVLDAATAALVEGIPSVLSGVRDALWSAFPQYAGHFLQIETSLSRIGEAVAPLVPAFETAGSVVGDALGTLLDKAGDLLDLFADIVESVDWSSVSGGVDGVASAAAGIAVDGFDALVDAGQWVLDNWQGVSDALVTFGGAVGSAAAAVGTLKLLFDVMTAGSLATWIAQLPLVTTLQTAWTTATNLASTAQAAFNLVMGANPLAVVATLIAAVVAALAIFFTQTETGRQAWAAFTEFVSGVWESIKTTALEVWGGITSTVGGAVEKVSGFLANLSPTAVIDTFNSIKRGISEKIEGARDAVKGAIDKIKGFFNFQWSLPHIKLPHFSVSGSANPIDWLTQGVPSIHVDWYAKGGIVDGATLIGAGEAGPEMILPQSGGIMDDFAAAVTGRTVAGDQMVVDWLERNLGRTIADNAPEMLPRQFNRAVRGAMA